MATTFFVPTKPYSIIDCINRIAAATGSVRYAQGAAHADYNGHHNVLGWNSYRGYYVGEYFWGGREVFVRSHDFATALEATLREFDRQGRGATLDIAPREEDVPAAMTHPRLKVKTDEAVREANSWMDWRYAEAASALRMEKTFGISHTHHLIEATDEADYRHRIDAEFAARREQRQPAAAC